jgi:hypothetical protein
MQVHHYSKFKAKVHREGHAPNFYSPFQDNSQTTLLPIQAYMTRATEAFLQRNTPLKANQY